MKTDKLIHFLAGYGICATALLLFPLWVAVLAAAVAGTTKELYDLKIKKTRFDAMDLLATAMGGVAFAIASTFTGMG